MAKKIIIEIAKQRLKAYENEKEILNIPCVTGGAKHDTPAGKFKILNKERTRRSSKYNAQINYALQLNNDGIFIHESYNYNEDPKNESWTSTVVSDTTTTIMSNLRVWVPGIKEVDISLGQVNLTGSHGCIRLAHTDAVKLFDWAELKTPVYVK